MPQRSSALRHASPLTLPRAEDAVLRRWIPRRCRASMMRCPDAAKPISSGRGRLASSAYARSMKMRR